MLTQLTILSTMAVHHVLIGGALLLLLLLITRAFKISSELQSWLWLTAFIIATLYPASLLTKSPSESNRLVIKLADKQTIKKVLSDKNNAASITIKQTPTASNINLARQPEWHLPNRIIFQMSNILMLLIGIWILGSIWRSIQVMASWWRTRQMIHQATPLDNNHPLNQLSHYPLSVSDTASSPMAAGLINPVILMPHSLLSHLTHQQLTPVVLHEVAHIKRGDLWFGVFQELIAILFWWSPVVRWLNRRIHINREIACDIRAAQELQSGKLYAQSLIDCAKLMLTQQRNILAMGLFSHKKDLNHRVEEVLQSNQTSRPKTIAILSACFMVAVATVSTAQTYAPKINVDSVEQQSKFFSNLSEEESELLLAAVSSNNLKVLKVLLEDGIDINTPVIGDGTPLIIAVKRENLELVKSLIDLGADVNQAARGDGNPLITAAMVNNLPIAKLLVENGADVNGIVPGDETPLINATRGGYMALTQWLVENGADVNLKVKTNAWDGFEVRSPLNQTSSNEIREYLIAQGATD